MRDEVTPVAAPRRETASPVNPVVAASNLFIGLAIVGVLYVGRELLVPVVIAALLGFVLAPLVQLFRRWHAGRVGGVLAAVVLVMVVVGGLGTVMAEQATQLIENLPRYERTITEKIHILQGAATKPGIFSRLSQMAGDLRRDISRPQGQSTVGAAHIARPSPVGTPAKPVTVEIQSPTARPIETIESMGAPLLALLVRAGIVLVFVIFMLLFREDLRDRFLRLAGSRVLGRTSAAMDDAGRRLSRYYLIQLSVNAAFGVLIGLSLWLIGIPGALLWGVSAALLRFVPFVGAIIAAAGPAALAIAVDPGWSMLIWTLAVYAVIELTLGQVVEPLLYGHHTGLSPVAVIVAAAFWTALWGPIGLLISTPLTVCVMVLGRHVERFKFLHVILGDQPALTPAQSFFQRMLAGDSHEVADQAEKFLKAGSLCAFYDRVAIPGLMLARLDTEQAALDTQRVLGIKETVAELVEDLSDHDDTAPDEPAKHMNAVAATDTTRSGEAMAEAPHAPLPVVSPEELRVTWRGETPVLCIGARDALDEAAAAILQQLLEKHGVKTRLEAPAAASAANVLRLESTSIALICVVCLGEPNALQRRYLVRRLRRRLPRAQLIVVDLRGTTLEDVPQEDPHEPSGADAHVYSLRETLEVCIAAAQEPIAVSSEATVLAAPTEETHRSGQGVHALIVS